MNLRLVKLTDQYQRHLNDMMEEWLAYEQDFSPYAIRKNDYRDFATYCEQLENHDARNGFVPDSVFFCLDEDRDIFVGAVNIRHQLNEHLCHSGGHIGDGIRPSERRKGYATAMIGLALEECRKLGIRKVLMTCDSNNIGSAKSIQRNGGVMDYEICQDGVPEQRYWITLAEETVESQRLILRRQMPADYREADAWCRDERVYKYLLVNAFQKAEDMLPWLERQDPNDPDRYVMLIRSKEDNHAIGTVGFFRDRERDLWSFAYLLRQDAQGKGYATEATRAMMHYVQEKYGAHTFEAECAQENIASARVMEKLGMKRIAVSSYEKHDGSAVFPSYIYRLEV